MHCLYVILSHYQYGIGMLLLNEMQALDTFTVVCMFVPDAINN